MGGERGSCDSVIKPIKNVVCEDATRCMTVLYRIFGVKFSINDSVTFRIEQGVNISRVEGGVWAFEDCHQS